jgi:hypothetical protein
MSEDNTDFGMIREDMTSDRSTPSPVKMTRKEKISAKRTPAAPSKVDNQPIMAAPPAVVTEVEVVEEPEKKFGFFKKSKYNG